MLELLIEQSTVDPEPTCSVGLVPVGEFKRPLDEMLKLANISWIRILLKAKDCVLGKTGHGHMVAIGIALKEVLRQGKNIRATLPERGKLDREGIQTIKQVSAK